MSLTSDENDLAKIAIAASKIPEAIAKLSPPRAKVTVDQNLVFNDVPEALRSFQDIRGYLQHRRTAKTLQLSSEAELQDILYVMLRPIINDLVPEQPIQSTTRQYSIGDFRSNQLQLVIEAKLVRDKAHGKSIKKELHEDIGECKVDPTCKYLIFFIYDPQVLIESPSGLRKLSGNHSLGESSLRVECIVIN